MKESRKKKQLLSWIYLICRLMMFYKFWFVNFILKCPSFPLHTLINAALEQQRWRQMKCGEKNKKSQG